MGELTQADVNGEHDGHVHPGVQADRNWRQHRRKEQNLRENEQRKNNCLPHAKHLAAPSVQQPQQASKGDRKKDQGGIRVALRNSAQV